MEVIIDKLNELINDGWSINSHDYFTRWESRVEQILIASFNQEVAREFKSLSPNDPLGLRYNSWERNLPGQIGFLEGLILKGSAKLIPEETIQSVEKTNIRTFPKTNKVFIVHGHDVSVKESVARYLEKIGLAPIILHEQPNSGKTIIEKFEVFSDVEFAVILLTPDDIGSTKENKEELNERARQNVIMELGYFLGKLGRERVCVLYKEGVEIPSDYQGVLYTLYDSSDGWKMKLAQVLNQCGFSLNIEAILG